MQGVAPFLQRAREKRLIASPSKAPQPIPLHENEENEVPGNVLEAFNAMNIEQPSKLKSGLKDVPRAPKSVAWGPNRNDSGHESDGDSCTPLPELENVVPEVRYNSSSSVHDMSEFVPDESAFTGLPGMDVYRDRAGSDSEHQSGAEDGDEDLSDKSDGEQSILESLTDLVMITKKLSLREEQKSYSYPVNHTANIGRKTRAEVRERFIGRDKNEEKKFDNKRYDLTRQSVSEIEESDVGRPSEVILSNFPLLPDYESGKEGSCEATEMYTPSHANREEDTEYYYNSARKFKEADDEPYDIDVFMHPDFRMSSSSDDEEEEEKQPQQRKKVPPAPPNTPLPPPPPPPPAKRGTTPPPPMRRASVVYTPVGAKGGERASLTEQPTGIPEFRRSSVMYLSEGERDAPKTPPKQMVAARVKPPKTEAQHRTKSRIELGSPLDAICHAAPSAQSGLSTGSMSVPPKSRAQPQKTLTRRLIAVADTNVLLQNLTLVENTQNYPQVVLVIPSAVVRELDGLKNGNSQTARDARVALHSLRKLLEGAKSRTTIKFQNIDEVPKCRSYRGRAKCNDDRILDCCLYYAENAQNEQGHKVVLLTNDVALQVKAESFGQGRDAPQLSAMGLRAFYEKEVWQLA